MSRSVERTVVIRCDFCNEVCTPLTRRDLAANLIARAPARRRKNIAVVDFTGYIPLENKNPDVCNTCARLAFTELLASIPE